jgi:hypothetical protein
MTWIQAEYGGRCLYSELLGRQRQMDHLSPVVEGQPGQPSETPSLKQNPKHKINQLDLTLYTWGKGESEK